MMWTGPCCYYVMPFLSILNRPPDLAPERRREKDRRSKRNERRTREESIINCYSSSEVYSIFV